MRVVGCNNKGGNTASLFSLTRVTPRADVLFGFIWVILFDLVLGTPPALQEKVQEKDQDDADDDKGKAHSCTSCRIQMWRWFHWRIPVRTSDVSPKRSELFRLSTIEGWCQGSPGASVYVSLVIELSRLLFGTSLQLCQSSSLGKMHTPHASHFLIIGGAWGCLSFWFLVLLKNRCQESIKATPSNNIAIHRNTS